jgi:hypothetical protein
VLLSRSGLPGDKLFRERAPNCEFDIKVMLQMVLYAVPLVTVMQRLAHATEITLLCAAALEFVDGPWSSLSFRESAVTILKPTFGIINVITERVRKGGRR